MGLGDAVGSVLLAVGGEVADGLLSAVGNRPCINPCPSWTMCVWMSVWHVISEWSGCSGGLAIPGVVCAPRDSCYYPQKSRWKWIGQIWILTGDESEWRRHGKVVASAGTVGMWVEN